MMDEVQVDQWRTQSSVTRVGPANASLDRLAYDSAGLRRVSRQLVTHYMGSSDGTSGPITGERLHETDMRYADVMFARLLALGGPELARERPTEERIAGCCRDFTILFVAMARHKGIPARLVSGSRPRRGLGRVRGTLAAGRA